MSAPDAARVEPARRCIWLDEADLATPLDSAFREVVRAKFKAAPADSAATVKDAIRTWHRADDADSWGIREEVFVLRALGWEAPA